MTLKIRIQVPQPNADYEVKVTTDDGITTYLVPGEEVEYYLHSGRSITSVEEVPSGTKAALSKE